ncbi:hypothetical protein [Mesorhizobium sp.]|uniref:hypothetical protein n=1 Tax=Mesorhizobium sp. TaxID=1871066 RepID=UPI0025846B7D|nr:hypothetical protein [Mesorhizobium sp.]
MGLYLVLRHIHIAVQRRRLKSDVSEGGSDLPEEEEVSWDWESPVDLATEPASSSQVAVPSDTADLGIRRQDANSLRFGVQIEYFDVISEACESSSVTQTNAFASATNIAQPGRLATSIREIAGYVHRQVAADLAALTSPVRALSRMPTQLALAKDPDPTTAMASRPRVRRPVGLVPRFGVAAICLAVPLSYAMTRQNWVERAPAISRVQGNANPSRPIELPASAALDVRGPAQGDERTSVELLSPDLTAARAQVGAAAARAAAARELAGQEHQAAEGERARSAALQRALLKSRKEIDALRTSMAAAANVRQEQLRNELAAARTADALRRLAGDARTMLSEATNYVFTEMPAAHLERQRAGWVARDLSRAQAQIERLETEAAEDRAKAKASLAQASGMLDDERRKSDELRGELSKVKLSNAALMERADAAEQELTGAVTARERVEQTAAETERALARQQAAAASTREELKKARLERDAAEQERARAVSARKRAEQTATETSQALARERAAAVSTGEELKKTRIERDAADQERARAVAARERVEQTATETAHALARERAAAVSTHEDLDKARLERDAARALLLQVARLKEALDKQRDVTVSLSRDLAAARADNDRLRAERRSAKIEPPLKRRAGRAAAAAGGVKAVSQKTARSKARDPARIAGVRSLTLPYPLRPRQATLE